MSKFCANLTTLFTEHPFLERFGAARTAGFGAVEVPFPYDHAVPDMLDMLGRNGLALAMIACPPPNYTGGDRGFAAVPDRIARFRQDFKRTIRYGKALGVQHVHVMAGVARGPSAREIFVDNLRWAAQEAPQQSLTIEPMCPEEVPGYFLNDMMVAAEIVEEVGATNLGLQFDVHHIHALHGDVVAVWNAVAPQVRHVQMAQGPGRLSPDTAGPIDFDALNAAIKQSGYKGWVSGEYAPKGPTATTLGWIG